MVYDKKGNVLGVFGQKNRIYKDFEQEYWWEPGDLYPK